MKTPCELTIDFGCGNQQVYNIYDLETSHNVAKRPFGISISERLYLFSRTPSGAPNGSPALTYKWTTQLLKEIAPPWPLDLSEGHGGGPGVVGDEQH